MKKWFTVSRNPVGFLGKGNTIHVEPGKVSGHHHVQANSPQEAIKKIYGFKKPKMVAKGFIPKTDNVSRNCRPSIMSDAFSRNKNKPTFDDFYTEAQEKWETEGNATQLDERKVLKQYKKIYS